MKNATLVALALCAIAGAVSAQTIGPVGPAFPEPIVLIDTRWNSSLDADAMTGMTDVNATLKRATVRRANNTFCSVDFPYGTTTSLFFPAPLSPTGAKLMARAVERWQAGRANYNRALFRGLFRWYGGDGYTVYASTAVTIRPVTVPSGGTNSGVQGGMVEFILRDGLVRTAGGVDWNTFGYVLLRRLDGSERPCHLLRQNQAGLVALTEARLLTDVQCFMDQLMPANGAVPFMRIHDSFNVSGSSDRIVHSLSWYEN
jgi:hypothetical protein